MDYKARYNEWIGFDEETKKELLSISDNEKEIEDRFYRDLEFGTAGLRGVIGAGTNRMNMYTVRKATQGLANFIISQGGQDRGVAIAFDSRRMSVEFSEEAALCLCANGIKAYRFETLRPTPELSFALRELNCIAGIVITASHNPPEYNGYKVYWEDGAQITAPKDKQIIEEVNSITDYSVAKTMDRKTAEEKGLYKVIGKDIDDLYIAALKKQVIHPEIIKEMGKELNIVYTPLHGTGMMPVKRIFEELGFENVHYVPVQSEPDENFSTVAYPNPEDPAAFKMALDLAKEKNADIVLATDPDADRLGIYVYDTATKEYVAFTGNMSAMIIGEYLLSQRKEAGTIASDGAMIKTIVSTNMADKIAEYYNIKLIEVLTGFKYIGEQIKFFEQTGKGNYGFGFEESYGCLVGTHARDKDAIVAVMSLCEAAAFYKKQGITLWDQMNNMYEKYGYFKEGLQNLVLKGIDGAQKIKEIMGNLRSEAPKKIAGYKVLAVRDYLNDTITLADGSVKSTGLPKSDVMYYDLDKDAWVCVRPSGTEPKIKFYVGVKGSSSEDADKQMEVLKNALNTELVRQ